MRLLIISAAYSPDPGGVARHVVTLAHSLVANYEDCLVHVLTLRKAGGAYKKDVKGRLTEWKLERQSVPEFSGRRVVFGRLFDLVVNHWHELEPDIIHAHDLDSLQVAWMLRTAFQKPVVLTVHRAPTQWRHAKYRENPKDCFMEAARIHRFVDQIVVPSTASARVLRSQGFRKIKIIPHAITKHLLSFESDAAVLQRLAIPDDAPLVFCPVRADEHKDPQILVRAAPLILQGITERQPVFLVVSEPDDPAADATASKELRAVAGAHGLEVGRQIVFERPFAYGRPLATVLRRSAVVVVPSLRESFGQNVLDAFLFGKPVVARNSMALPEIVQHDRTGLLFDTKEELAAHVRRLILDTALSARIVKAAADLLAERYDVSKMAAQYREVYDAILKHTGTEGRQRR